MTSNRNEEKIFRKIPKNEASPVDIELKLIPRTKPIETGPKTIAGLLERKKQTNQELSERRRALKEPEGIFERFSQWIYWNIASQVTAQKNMNLRVLSLVSGLV